MRKHDQDIPALARTQQRRCSPAQGRGACWSWQGGGL